MLSSFTLIGQVLYSCKITFVVINKVSKISDLTN